MMVTMCIAVAENGRWALFADLCLSTLRPNSGNETNVRESVTKTTIRATDLFRHLFAIGQLEITIPIPDGTGFAGQTQLFTIHPSSRVK